MTVQEVSLSPLQGLELIDCARANCREGLQKTAERCGYGSDLTTFEQELRQACAAIGVEIVGLTDLVSTQFITPGK